MTYGPIDFVALEFKGNQFKGEILPAIMDLVSRRSRAGDRHDRRQEGC